MHVLAIDSSAKTATAALLRDGEVVSQLSSDQLVEGDSPEPGQNARSRPGTSALLTPLVQAVLKRSDVAPEQLQLVAIATGPGLFTGLRIGVVTAKAFAFACKVPVIGVNTLEVIAARAAMDAGAVDGDGLPSTIRVAINAQRQQLFTGTYQATGPWAVSSHGDNQIEDRQSWIDGWTAEDLVSGAGLSLVRDATAARLQQQPDVRVAPESLWNCDAVAVARVAVEHFGKGRRDDPWKLQPFYFRPSAAEEARLAN